MTPSEPAKGGRPVGTTKEVAAAKKKARAAARAKAARMLGNQPSPIRCRFADEYPLDLSITDAAIRAGYSAKGAAKSGWAAFQDPLVQARIQKNFDERSKRTQIDSDKVLIEISHSAFSNVTELFGDSGELIPVSKLPRNVAAAISSIEVVTRKAPGGLPTDIEYVSKIKLWDKIKSLELLGKHLELFTEKHKHDVGDNLQSLLDLIKPTVGPPSERGKQTSGDS